MGLGFGLGPSMQQGLHVAAAMPGTASLLAAAETVPPVAVLELLGIGQRWQCTWAPRSTWPLAVCRDRGAFFLGASLSARHSIPEQAWCL